MRNTVLIVDDVEMNREILSEILEEKYEILQAENGTQALETVEKEQDRIAVILLDLVMPGLDGFGVLKELKAGGLMSKIPVLVISGDCSIESERICFDYGVSDFVHKPFFEELVIRRVNNIVDLYNYKNGLEEKVAEQTATILRQLEALKAKNATIEASKLRTIETLGTVVESRDRESGEHVQRVKGYTKALAEQLMADYPEYGLTGEKVTTMVSASTLHDVGKIAIPDAILCKPGRLTKEEYEEMKTHTTEGCRILATIRGIWDEEFYQMSYDICRYHHERYDGKGYPDKLTGEQIPICAQIVAIADVYDALVCERVYKKAFPPDVAFQMIQEGQCGTFSRKILDAFRNARASFEKIARS